MKSRDVLWRIGLSGLIIALGIGVLLVVGVTTGLALSELPDAPVELITETTYSDELYVVMEDGSNSIYHSDDAGLTWQQVNTELEEINALAIHPTNKQVLYVGTNDRALSGNNLWYSHDNGQTWNPYEAKLPASANGQLPYINILTVDPNHPDLLYVGTEGQGLYRIQSGNAEFEPIGGTTLQNLYVTDVVVSPGSPVYAITTEGLLVIEGGAWRKLESLPDTAVSLVVDPQNPKTLYAGTTAYGVFRSTDSGQTWQPINDGLGWQPGIIMRVSAIAVDEDDPKHLALATAYGVGSHLAGDGIYESFNGGRHWVKIAERQDVVDELTVTKGAIYAATDEGLVHYGDPLLDSPLIRFPLFQIEPLK